MCDCMVCVVFVRWNTRIVMSREGSKMHVHIHPCPSHIHASVSNHEHNHTTKRALTLIHMHITRHARNNQQHIAQTHTACKILLTSCVGMAGWMGMHVHVPCAQFHISSSTYFCSILSYSPSIPPYSLLLSSLLVYAYACGFPCAGAAPISHVMYGSVGFDSLCMFHCIYTTNTLFITLPHHACTKQATKKHQRVCSMTESKHMLDNSHFDLCSD